MRAGQALQPCGLGGLNIGRLHTRSAPAVRHSVTFDHQGFGLAKQGALARLVARQAVAEGCGRFEWSVLDWNEPAIRFYRRLGAVGLDEWTVQRVSGEALRALADAST